MKDYQNNNMNNKEIVNLCCEIENKINNDKKYREGLLLPEKDLKQIKKENNIFSKSCKVSVIRKIIWRINFIIYWIIYKISNKIKYRRCSIHLSTYPNCKRCKSFYWKYSKNENLYSDGTKRYLGGEK